MGNIPFVQDILHTLSYPKNFSFPRDDHLTIHKHLES